jgi:hypothetical protein
MRADNALRYENILNPARKQAEVWKMIRVLMAEYFDGMALDGP